MGLPLGDIKLSANFELNVAKPLDSRLVVGNISERNNITFKYSGMIVWVKNISKQYVLLNDLVSWQTFGDSAITKLEDLENVLITTPVNNQSLVYDSASTSWINKTISGGSGGGVLVNHNSNKVVNSYPTSGNNSTTGISISNTPLGDVVVSVNGVLMEIGYGITTGKCYFVDPFNLGVPKNFLSIVANDVLIWNGTNVGYELDISDEISFYYES